MLQGYECNVTLLDEQEVPSEKPSRFTSVSQGSWCAFWAPRGVLPPSWSPSSAHSPSSCPSAAFAMTPRTHMVPRRHILASTTIPLQAEPNLALSFSLLTFLLSLSSLDASLPSQHYDPVWFDFLRGSPTTFWSMRVLLVFGEYKVPRGLMQ